MLGWQRVDVHQTTITVAVEDSAGKMVTESILETKASTILEFIQGWAEPYRSLSLSLAWQLPASTMSIGHFYFAQLGHSHFAATAATYG
jgi:hypothetical protein